MVLVMWSGVETATAIAIAIDQRSAKAMQEGEMREKEEGGDFV